MRRSPTLLVLPLALLAAGCSVLRGPRHVTFASDPPGATVKVGGEESGFATPCRFALPRKTQRIDLELAGYEPERILLEPGRRAYSLEWPEMIIYPNTWRFPLWIPIQDALTGIHVKRELHPSRVFVRLKRSADT